MTQQMSWKTYSGGQAANYERYFVPAIGAPLANDLIELAELRPGERVLDVACGTGVVTRLAAERVDGAAVAGLDVNPGMLQVAREVTGDAAIEWHEASAEALPLGDETFEVVLCQMGLQFIPRPTGRTARDTTRPRAWRPRRPQRPWPYAAPARRPRAGAPATHRARGRRIRCDRLFAPRQ
jgi:SAM-dependent methyltransferase